MFLGIDLGTGSVKALLLDNKGSVLHKTSQSYDVHSPHLGWAESNPEDWWQATCKAVKACMLDFPTDELQSIGFSGQMHGTVLCDNNMQVVRPAVLWADTRSTPQLERYNSLSPNHKQRLANPVATGMMGASLLWLKENETENYNQAHWALLPKDWLRYQFTGEVHTDPSDASGTLLYDLLADDWAFEIVKSLGLRGDLLAPIVGSSSVAGHLTPSAATALDLQKGIPIAAGGADAACSAYGNSLTNAGQVQINIGTAMQIFAIQDKPTSSNNPNTHLYRTVESNYYAMAAMQNAGIAFEWLRKTLDLTWEEMYEAAATAPSGSEGLLFLPYLTGERTPHLNSEAKGTWHGLTLKHKRNHLVRSVFEGIGFALKDGMIALEQTGISSDSLCLAGGGTTEPLWQQLLADVLQKPLYEIESSSASAKGAARLAAKAVGTTFDNFTKEPKLVAEPKESEALDEAFTKFQNLYRLLY